MSNTLEFEQDIDAKDVKFPVAIQNALAQRLATQLAAVQAELIRLQKRSIKDQKHVDARREVVWKWLSESSPILNQVQSYIESLNMVVIQIETDRKNTRKSLKWGEAPEIFYELSLSADDPNKADPNSGYTTVHIVLSKKIGKGKWRAQSAGHLSLQERTYPQLARKIAELLIEEFSPS